MTLLNYSADEIREILSSILERNDFYTIPVGNHHLKRHLVYKVHIDNEEPIIFKLYYKTKRRSREIASLRLLENSKVKCPKILQYGSLENGQEWLIMDYIEGELFDNIIDKVPKLVQLSLFEQLGEELGKIHAFKTFDFFGEWDENGRSIRNIRTFSEGFVANIEDDIKILLSQNIESREILDIGIDKIRDGYDLLNLDITPRLLHSDFDGRNVLVNKVNEEYSVSGVIDFEGSCPGNPEQNFASLYYRYFLDNKDYERSFFQGYEKHLQVNEGFHKRLDIYLLCFIVGNCSWAFWQAPDYYNENIKVLKKLLKE